VFFGVLAINLCFFEVRRVRFRNDVESFLQEDAEVTEGKALPGNPKSQAPLRLRSGPEPVERQIPSKFQSEANPKGVTADDADGRKWGKGQNHEWTPAVAKAAMAWQAK